MKRTCQKSDQTSEACCSRRAFTLIELLTVIAIITLLISILVPALSRARSQAKATATRATIKASGQALDMFRNENPQDVVGEGYPASARADDPTIDGLNNDIFGAQWLVRYLCGKNLDGYIPRKNVPRSITELGVEGWEQKGWYPDPNDPAATVDIDRAGPYLNPEGVKFAAPDKLPGFPPQGMPLDADAMKQLVLLDNFDVPILYYAADYRAGRKASTPMARYTDDDPNAPPAVYTFMDNGPFTGHCTSKTGGSCTWNSWNFGQGEHKIHYFGTFTNDIPNRDQIDDEDNLDSFAYFIHNKNVFDSTDGRSLIPMNRDSFIMISAGPDGLYGTSDDVTNF